MQLKTLFPGPVNEAEPASTQAASHAYWREASDGVAEAVLTCVVLLVLTVPILAPLIIGTVGIWAVLGPYLLRRARKI